MATAKYKRGKDGYFQARVWNGSYNSVGKKIYVSLRSKKSSKDLENKVAEHNRLLKERSLVKSTDITFLDYSRQWLKIYKATKSLNTRGMYQNIIEKHFCILSGVKLPEITRMHYQLVLNQADGKTRTQQQIRCTFQQIIKSAIADKYLPAGILNDIFDHADTIIYRPKEKRPLTEYEKLAVFQADLEPSDRAFVYLLYGCGLRRGEAAALTASNIDLERRILTVNSSLAFDGNKPYIKAPKSVNGYREVPIPSKIYPYIYSYIKGLHGEKLFYMKDGGWMTKSSYDKKWNRIIKGMQKVSDEPINQLTAHVFRHNYCTNLCYQIPALSIKKIARLLGDTEKMVIEVYNHIILEKEDAETAIENALNF